MTQHNRIEHVRETLGIKTLSDWTRFTPGDVLSIDGIGDVTLDEIRLMLAGRKLALKNDMTADHWWATIGSTAIGTRMSDDEVLKPLPFGIVIDGRERIPYRFNHLTRSVESLGDGGELIKRTVSLQVATEYGQLKTGDYALIGYEDLAAVERKSLEDLYSTLGQGRERFEHEHERLAGMITACVVVEADYQTVMTSPPPMSQLNPKSVHGTFISWYQRYGVAWFFMPGARAAEKFTFSFLEKFYKNHVTKRVRNK